MKITCYSSQNQCCILSTVKKQYKIILISCRYDCCVQTSTFQFFFRWCTFWNL